MKSGLFLLAALSLATSNISFADSHKAEHAEKHECACEKDKKDCKCEHKEGHEKDEHKKDEKKGH